MVINCVATEYARWETRAAARALMIVGRPGGGAMFHWNIRIAATFFVCAAVVTTAAAQPHKGGGAPAARAAPAPHAAAAPHPAPAPHAAPAPRAAPAPHIAAPPAAPHTAAPNAGPRIAAPRHAPPAAAPRHAQAPRAVPQRSARSPGGPGTSAMARHAPPKTAAPAQPQVSGRNAGRRGNAKVAQPNQRENLARPGGPGGASAAAPSAPGGRNAARQQTVAPQQGTTGQNQAGRTAAPSAQPNVATRQAVIPQNQVNRVVPPSASRARAASDPRAFSGGVLRNQAFASLASARDPGARMLASSTFQGRFFNPQWRRHSA